MLWVTREADRGCKNLHCHVRGSRVVTGGGKEGVASRRPLPDIFCQICRVRIRCIIRPSCAALRQHPQLSLPWCVSLVSPSHRSWRPRKRANCESICRASIRGCVPCASPSLICTFRFFGGECSPCRLCRAIPVAENVRRVLPWASWWRLIGHQNERVSFVSRHELET